MSAAKLAAVELREAADDAELRRQQQSALQEGSVTWTNDRLVTECKGCSREFNMTRRKVIKLFNCSHAFAIASRSAFSLFLPSLSVLLSLTVQLRSSGFRGFLLHPRICPSLPLSLRVLRPPPFPSERSIRARGNPYVIVQLSPSFLEITALSLNAADSTASMSGSERRRADARVSTTHGRSVPRVISGWAFGLAGGCWGGGAGRGRERGRWAYHPGGCNPDEDLMNAQSGRSRRSRRSESRCRRHRRRARG